MEARKRQVKLGNALSNQLVFLLGFGLIFNLLIISIPAHAQSSQAASSCAAVIKQIGNDIIGSPARGGTVSDQPLVWKNLSWLQAQLGQTQPKSVIEDLYQWESYTLILREGKPTSQLGTLPTTSSNVNVSKVPTLGEAMTALGQPKKHVTAKMSEYLWTCPDNGATLKILTDDKGDVVDVLGKTCALNDPTCSEFAYNLGKSSLMRQEDVKMVQTAEVATDVETDKMLKAYNANFLAGIKGKNELKNDMAIRLKKFYTALRQCSPGIYKYAAPSGTGSSIIFYTATIKTATVQTCPVDLEYNIPGSNKGEGKCNFQLDSVPLFTDQAAEAIAGSAVNAAQSALEIEKILKTQCELSTSTQNH